MKVSIFVFWILSVWFFGHFVWQSSKNGFLLWVFSIFFIIVFFYKINSFKEDDIDIILVSIPLWIISIWFFGHYFWLDFHNKVIFWGAILVMFMNLGAISSLSGAKLEKTQLNEQIIRGEQEDRAKKAKLEEQSKQAILDEKKKVHEEKQKLERTTKRVDEIKELLK